MKTRFFTGRGDKGQSAFGNKRIAKDDALFELLGNLDELNSWLGLCAVEAKKTFSKKKAGPVRNGPPLGPSGARRAGEISNGAGSLVFESLEYLEEDLFIAQAEAAAIGFSYSIKTIPRITEAKTARLEHTIQKIDTMLPTLRNFVLPGGSELSAMLDIARAISRRAERSAVAFGRRAAFSKEFLQFMNRLSSALFALARYTNYVLRVKEKNPKYK